MYYHLGKIVCSRNPYTKSKNCSILELILTRVFSYLGCICACSAKSVPTPLMPTLPFDVELVQGRHKAEQSKGAQRNSDLWGSGSVLFAKHPLTQGKSSPGRASGTTASKRTHILMQLNN